MKISGVLKEEKKTIKDDTEKKFCGKWEEGKCLEEISHNLIWDKYEH